MNNNIAVIGQGFVGGSLTTVFAERGFKVYVYDKAGKVASGGTAFPNVTGIDQFLEQVYLEPTFSGVFFLCLPTPMAPDGSADLSILKGVIDQIVKKTIALDHGSDVVLVIKSTVPPGTTERLNMDLQDTNIKVIFCPEFLTEANALRDMRNQDRIIIGGPRSSHMSTVKSLFHTAFPNVLVVRTSSSNAEMVKYTINCFLATKVAFANEIAQLCEELQEDGYNIDYDKVISCAKLDKRLGDTHWAVPGPVPTHDGRYVRGFGGHCFPKDINALIFEAALYGVDMKVLRAAWASNLAVRSPEDRDWEHMPGRAVSELKND